MKMVELNVLLHHIALWEYGYKRREDRLFYVNFNAD